MPQNETIVFVHGIGRTPLSLIRVILAARSRGYKTLAWKYPSRKKTGEALANDLTKYLERNVPTSSTKVHFVTHSLGGHIVSLYLNQARSKLPGRVVMIAPPIGGSEVVDVGMSWPLFKELLGPVIVELKTRPDNSPVLEVPAEVAVIAGSRGQWPWSLLFRGQNDGKVSVASTKHIRSVEHVVLPYNHTELTFRAEVVKKALKFIATGSMY